MGSSMNKLIEELSWRGMIRDIMPGTEEQLNKEMTSGYVGFDPTADSLHIGSLVPILLLVHLQRNGHKPVALIGGATGMVGDPSGKSEERNLLDEATVLKNADGVRRQLEKFLDFTGKTPNSAEIVNNIDWFRDMKFLDFIRDVGKHISVNYMLAKDSVKNRLAGESGMSFTEFTYQLVQGYDFYWLNTYRHCKLQMGGSDQWGNMVTGTELIRRKSGKEAFAFTCPLITKADGGKFGKTEKGNIWLDPEKTSPYQFYQFWLNASDEDASKWIKIFTFRNKEEIETLLKQHDSDPGARKLQKALAEDLTIFVHGKEEWLKALETTEKLFSAQTPAEALTEEELSSIEGIIQCVFPAEEINHGADPLHFLSTTGIFASKGEARKMIQNGGVSINRKKLPDTETKIDTSMLLHEKFILVQKGKKNYYLVTVQ
jgi:tyrosyl-tRNA synthetase